MKLDTRQAQLRDLDPTVLIENEEDLVDFPPPKTYTFTKDPIYKAYEPSNNGDVLACAEGSPCGSCSTEFHYVWELQWSKGKKAGENDRAVHYHQTEANKKCEPYWKVAHTKTHMIIECTSHCACVKNGTCTNNLVQNRRENPLPFGKLSRDINSHRLRYATVFRPGRILFLQLIFVFSDIQIRR